VCETCHRRLNRRDLLKLAGLAAAACPPGLARAAEIMFPTEGLAVYHPHDFNFEEAPDSIEEEWSDIQDYYQAYFEALRGESKTSAYGMAIANQVIGIVRNDPDYIKRAGGFYTLHRDHTSDDKERQLAADAIAYCRYLLTGDYPTPSSAIERVEPVSYVKKPGPTGPFKKIVLGKSVIHVTRDFLVKSQVDRVTRDWLLAFQPTGRPWQSANGLLFYSHEGARLTEITSYSGARLVPVWGMKATKVGKNWYAPDETGTLRFQISPDKIREYPSTIVLDERHVIVNDTHGISALAWDSADANLVVGCGDHKGKMDAAYHLATKGIDVYVPTDRLLGLLIGADVKGTIIGSAPVKPVAGGAEIGNQPIEIDPEEEIVVSNAIAVYPLQYYDTPLRYFRALGEYCGRQLKITDVAVEEYGYAVPVVDTARDRNARLIGIRVKSVKEHDAVAAWLKEDARHRAVLFHTAAYKDGYKLFGEFPNQTSFGDIHPEFV
jgi:hypothetical protein